MDQLAKDRLPPTLEAAGGVRYLHHRCAHKLILSELPPLRVIKRGPAGHVRFHHDVWQRSNNFLQYAASINPARNFASKVAASASRHFHRRQLSLATRFETVWAQIFANAWKTATLNSLCPKQRKAWNFALVSI